MQFVAILFYAFLFHILRKVGDMQSDKFVSFHLMYCLLHLKIYMPVFLNNILPYQNTLICDVSKLNKNKLHQNQNLYHITKLL